MQTRKANDVSALTAKSDTTIAHISLISNFGAFVLLFFFTCIDNKVSFFSDGRGQTAPTRAPLYIFVFFFQVIPFHVSSDGLIRMGRRRVGKVILIIITFFQGKCPGVSISHRQSCSI